MKGQPMTDLAQRLRASTRPKSAAVRIQEAESPPYPA